MIAPLYLLFLPPGVSLKKNRKDDFMTFKQEHPETITISYKEYSELLKARSENFSLKKSNDFFLSRINAYSSIASILFSFTVLCINLLKDLHTIKPIPLFLLIFIGAYIGKLLLLFICSALVSLNQTFKSKLPYSLFILSLISCLITLLAAGYFF